MNLRSLSQNSNIYDDLFRLKTNILADCIVRSMVCYIAVESSNSNQEHLSPDQSLSTRFCHIHALQLAQQGTVPERKLGNYIFRIEIFLCSYKIVFDSFKSILYVFTIHSRLPGLCTYAS